MPEQWRAPWPEPSGMRGPPMRRGPSPPPMRGGPYSPLHMAQPTLPPLAAMPPPGRGPPMRGPLPYGPQDPPYGEPRRDWSRQPISLNRSPALRPHEGLSPPPGPSGPPYPYDRRESYPDIAQDYDAESHYEPSMHEEDRNMEVVREDSMEDAMKPEDGKPLLTKRQRYVKHLRRRWYFYAVGLILGLAIGLPVMFLVILPAIVQHMVDQAPFPLLAVALTNPSPGSFTMSMSTALNIPGGFSVELDASTLTLSQQGANGPDPQFAAINLPSYQLKGNTTLSVPPQNITIHDHSAFIDFIHTAAVSETYELTTSGSSIIRMGALHSNINIDKTLTVPGFNNFKGFSIPDAQLLLSPEADGTNLIGHATLPNPTVITIELGDFVMNMEAGGINLGTAIMSGVTLKPGNTTLPLKGKLDIMAVLNNLGPLLTSQASALENGRLAFNATMNKTTFNDVELPDFEKAFAGIVLGASIPISEVVGDSIKGFLGGNSSLGSITSDLMAHMDIPDLTSLLSRAEDQVEEMVSDYMGDKGSSSLLAKAIGDFAGFGG